MEWDLFWSELTLRLCVFFMHVWYEDDLALGSLHSNCINFQVPHTPCFPSAAPALISLHLRNQPNHQQTLQAYLHSQPSSDLTWQLQSYCFLILHCLDQTSLLIELCVWKHFCFPFCPLCTALQPHLFWICWRVLVCHCWDLVLGFTFDSLSTPYLHLLCVWPLLE